jgi:preprotein translocase subunit SecG
MVTVLFTLNALICVALIILILLQRSDPASGGMFGGAGGGAQPVVRNPLAKPTALLAAAFLIFSLVLAILNKGAGHHGSVMSNLPVAEASAPAVSPTVPAMPSLPAPGGAPVPAPAPAQPAAPVTAK